MARRRWRRADPSLRGVAVDSKGYLVSSQRDCSSEVYNVRSYEGPMEILLLFEIHLSVERSGRETDYPPTRVMKDRWTQEKYLLTGGKRWKRKEFEKDFWQNQGQMPKEESQL